jgi:hypothetical protein
VEQAMSVRKLTASLFTALALLGGVAPISVDAQEHVPVADPFAFDPDFQWFKPVYNMDLADMKPDKRAHNGWFATYDRLNLYASRPETEEPGISETMIDGGWGWRYEIGYMLPGEDKGWMFNWTHNNVGAFFGVNKERLNRWNGDQVIGGSGGNGVTGLPFGEVVRQQEANNRGYNYRWYNVQDTENVVGYDSYELNKTWRLEPYHYGGILEPMVGIRWMRVLDTNGFSDYQSSLENPPLVGPNFTDAEQLTTSTANTENEMFGGQVGFRYTKFRERFTFSSDLRVFFGGNWQNSRSQIVTELTTYTGSNAGDGVQNIFNDATEPIYARNEEFFVGFDIRGELGYQLTRMISLRGGFQLVDIGRGVWRGGDGTVVEGGDNDQDLLLVGGTFGINLNH